MDGLTFWIALYLVGAVALFTIFMVKYHQDQPWYTWTGKYTLNQAYWIGLASIAGMMLVGWWYAVILAIYGSIRSVIKGEYKWNKLR